MSRKPIRSTRLRRLAALAAVVLGLAAGSPLAPALAEPPDDTHGCPRGQFETPESCSGRPLLAAPGGGRLALRSGPIALHDGRRGEPYSVNVVESVGGSPAESEIQGRLPSGLSLEGSGYVTGVPAESGVFQFTVILSDPTTSPPKTSQTYVLRILAPAAPAAPSRPIRRAQAPAQPPAPRPAPAQRTHLDADELTGVMVIYELSAADVDVLLKGGDLYVPPPPGAAGPAGTTSGAPAAPASAPAAVATAPAVAPVAGAAPAAQPARSGGRPPTVAQVANVPGAAARAVGAPASVVQAAQLPANIAKRANSLAAAFRPLTPKKPRAPAQPAAQPEPAAPMVVVAEAAPPPPAFVPVPSAPQGPAGPLVATLPPDLLLKARPVIDVPYTSRELFKAALFSRVPLTPALLERVASRARKLVPYNQSPLLNWTSQGGCLCNPPPHGPEDKMVYGFFPFWRSGLAGPTVVFKRFNRIGLLGAQLQGDGNWIYPSNPLKGSDDWWAGLSRFAMTAQTHGVRLDLVLEGRDWAYLAHLDPETRRAAYEDAARKAMLLIDTPLQGRGLRALLLPFWRDPTYVFDGVTVMFDYPPPAALPEEKAAFKDFYDGFLRELVHQMERQGRRAYALNIVAPDDLGEPDRIQERGEVWRDFLSLKRLAEPASAHRDLPKSLSQLYVGNARISVRLLTPLREPTTNAKKGLRGALDSIPDIKGLDRVEVQRSTVPILYLPETPIVNGKPQPRVMPDPESTQLSDDLVYVKQNFGGVALWPIPVLGSEEDGEVYHRVQQVFFDEHAAFLGAAVNFCSLTLRLLLEFLIGLLLVGGIYYAIWGSASGRRMAYLIGLGVVGGLATIDFLVLLSFDPAFETLRIGNLPFITLLIVLGALAGWSLLRPRVPRP